MLTFLFALCLIATISFQSVNARYGGDSFGNSFGNTYGSNSYKSPYENSYKSPYENSYNRPNMFEYSHKPNPYKPTLELNINTPSKGYIPGSASINQPLYRSDTTTVDFNARTSGNLLNPKYNENSAEIRVGKKF